MVWKKLLGVFFLLLAFYLAYQSLLAVQSMEWSLVAVGLVTAFGAASVGGYLLGVQNWLYRLSDNLCRRRKEG